MSTESCGHTTKWRAPWRQLGKEILKFVKIKIMCFVIAEKSTSPSHCSPTPIIPLTTLLHPAPHLLCLSQTPTPPLPTTETTSSQSCFTPTIWRSSYTEGCTFMLFWMADKIIVHSYIPRHASTSRLARFIVWLTWRRGMKDEFDKVGVETFVCIVVPDVFWKYGRIKYNIYCVFYWNTILWTVCFKYTTVFRTLKS